MTLLIKNVQVLGAEKRLPERADIFISGDKISALGSFPNKRADEVIEGQGTYASPGFIDINAAPDHDLALFHEPTQRQFIERGVTTVVGGQGGVSLAPLLYGDLEALEEWAYGRLVNVNWHTLEEWKRVMEKKPLGVNFGTLVGHHTVRRAIAGEEGRDLTKNELEVMSKVLGRSLEEGGFGLSSGLDGAHGRGTSYHELRKLLHVVAARGGLYATPLRRPGELNVALAEIVRLAKETGTKTVVNDFAPRKGEEEWYEKSLAFIESFPLDFNFHFSVSPEPATVVPITRLLPAWAQSPDLAVTRKHLRDDWFRHRITKDMPSVEPEKILVTRAAHESLVGRTLQDFMEVRGIKNKKEAFLDLMSVTDLKAVVSCRDVDEEVLKKALRHPRSLITGNIPAFLSSVMGGGEKNSVEEAIQKIASKPARLFGMAGRGELKEGNYADVVGFAHRGGEIEIKFVIVNGRLAVKDGVFRNVCAGRVLVPHK